MNSRRIAVMLLVWLAVIGCASPPVATPTLPPPTDTLPPPTVTATPAPTATPTRRSQVVTRTPTPTVTLTSLQAQQLAVMKAIFPEYDGPEDICQWERMEIECNEQGHITKLDLGNEGLKRLPPEIGQLSSLEYLWVYGNELTTLPQEFSQLSDLRFLSLSRNPLVSLPPEMKQLSHLEELWISGDQMGLLEQIGQIPNLWAVIVFGIDQPTIVLPEIGWLTNVTSLKLAHLDLETLPPEIGLLTNLRTLDLSDNNLTDLPPEIGKLSNLQQLNISANPLTSLPPELCAQIGHAVVPADLCP